MISAAIIEIPPRKRIVRHDGGGGGMGGYGQIKHLGGIFLNPKYHKNFT